MWKICSLSAASQSRTKPSATGVRRSGSTTPGRCGADEAGWATPGIWMKSSSRCTAADGRGPGRRPARHPGPVAPRPPSSRALLSQGVKRTRPIAKPSCHGQAAQLLGSPPYRHADRGAQHSAVREQPSGGLASTDAATRATDAPVQIRGARAAVSLGTRTRTESLPGRPPSTAVGAPPIASDAGVRRMGCGDVCLLNDEKHRAIEGSSRPLLINLTVPGDSSLGYRGGAGTSLRTQPSPLVSR